MDYATLLNIRRSWRHYKKTPVPENLIEELISAASLAPVSCNLQLTQYVVVNNQEILETLAKEASYKFKYAPCTIVVLHDSRFSIERESGIMTAGMAVENMLLKATELGLATCPMAGFGEDKKIKNILHIPSHMDILLIIALGYPDESFSMEKMPRIAVDERYTFNSYANLKTINDSSNLSEHSIADIINYRKRIGPVYLDRFRLNSYNESYYEDVFSVLLKEVSPGKEHLHLLDLMSYDGVFLKTLHKNDVSKKFSATASDYLQSNLAFLKNKLGYEGALIAENNSLPDHLISFDVVSFIFQSNFTPKLPALLKEAYKVLKPEGFLIVANIEESWYRKIAYRLNHLYKKWILGKKINIYENNTFYKIGPIERYSENNLLKMYTTSGFQLTKEYILRKKLGVSVKIYIFKK